MSKLLIIFGLFLVSIGAIAGTCNNSTVSGSYTFSLASIGNSSGLITSTYDAGRFGFNGAGSVSVFGVESKGGVSGTFSVIGTYSVSTSCILSILFTQPPSPLIVAKTFSLSVFLDSLDTLSSVNTAYHGNVVYKTNLGMSGIGEINNVKGKF